MRKCLHGNYKQARESDAKSAGTASAFRLRKLLFIYCECEMHGFDVSEKVSAWQLQAFLVSACVQHVYVRTLVDFYARKCMLRRVYADVCGLAFTYMNADACIR